MIVTSMWGGTDIWHWGMRSSHEHHSACRGVLEAWRVGQASHMLVQTAPTKSAHETIRKKRKQANSQLLKKWLKTRKRENNRKIVKKKEKETKRQSKKNRTKAKFPQAKEQQRSRRKQQKPDQPGIHRQTCSHPGFGIAAMPNFQSLNPQRYQIFNP